MIRYDIWPPPDWDEVVITWESILMSEDYKIFEVFEWISKTPGSRYHLHGWKQTKGFAYRFEDPKDAVLFALRWT
jgi:hypothetical protein